MRGGNWVAEMPGNVRELMTGHGSSSYPHIIPAFPTQVLHFNVFDCRSSVSRKLKFKAERRESCDNVDDAPEPAHGCRTFRLPVCAILYYFPAVG